MPIIELPSPNFDSRNDAGSPSILVLHYTGMKSCAEAVARLTDPASRVSSHYTIDEDGTIYRHVPDNMRAWHAGASSWRGQSDVNSRSIGIEIVNPGHEFGYRRFPDAQIETVLSLGLEIVQRYSIPPRNVVGHSDVAPERKTDPGELFPWQELAVRGLGVWVSAKKVDVPLMQRGAMGAQVLGMQKMFANYGYEMEANGSYDEKTEFVVKAFQRHFRPSLVDGISDSETQNILFALHESLDLSF